jgi:hypothetical protein
MTETTETSVAQQLLSRSPRATLPHFSRLFAGKPVRLAGRLLTEEDTVTPGTASLERAAFCGNQPFTQRTGGSS